MRRTTLIVACALLAGALAWAPWSPARAADDEAAAVQKRFGEFAAAWGKHDPKAMAALWAEDGDLINPWGRWAKGRGEVEKLFADEQTGQGPLRESTFKPSGENVRLVSADVAVFDCAITVTDVHRPDGTKGTMEFHLSGVWKKSGGTWWMVAARPYLKQAAPAGHVK